ncbi:nose resistant to fluoxetine protein 6-like [Tribolium madens]|uniref:nose resistant to fluoxetine protein 6-like n=1 Tax=Tribolium madens TaxID=41895 RepID=UPI001CF721E7|nr:nose resistant to fluoxetine protein 6-like [Tribolium madens]
MFTNKCVFYFFVFFSTSCGQFLTPDLMLTLLKGKIYGIIDKTIDNNNQCGQDLKLFISALENKELWALKMLDASAKPGPGILKGNVFLIGDYEQCLGIRQVVKGHEIVGMYCNVVLKPNRNFRWDFSEKGAKLEHMNSSISQFLRGVFDICVPKSCTSQNLIQFWEELTGKFASPLDVSIRDDHCHYQNKKITPETIDIFVFFFFGIITLVVLFSTIYEIYLFHIMKTKVNQSRKFLLIFSLYTNTKKLISTHCENEQLTCLYGIKVLSMGMIVGGHMAAIRTAMGSKNPIYFFSEWPTYWHNSLFVGSFFGVETFFCIGGVLVSYLQLKYSEKYQINIFWFYLHRIFRLTPALFVVVLLYLSVLKYICEGPFWPLMLNYFVDNCHKTWWMTLLFVSNYLNIGAQCVTHSWYLAVDTQLYLIAPFLIFNLKKHTTRVVAGMTTACFICILYSFIVTMKNNFGAILFFDSDLSYLKYYYMTPMAHLAPWSFGILLGYVLYRQNYQKIVISKRQNHILMALSLSTMLALHLLCTVLVRQGRDSFYSALFNCFARPLWALALCVLIFNCYTGNGGFINTFLSHPVFIVLGKLTYSMYLLHVPVIFVIFFGIKDETSTISTTILFLDYWGTMLVTGACSAILCLVFETPVINLFQIVERSDYSRKKSNY